MDLDFLSKGDIVEISNKTYPHNEWEILEFLIGGYKVKNTKSGEVLTPLWEHVTLLWSKTGASRFGTICPVCKTPWQMSKSPVLDIIWRDCTKCKKTAEEILEQDKSPEATPPPWPELL